MSIRRVVAHGAVFAAALLVGYLLPRLTNPPAEAVSPTQTGRTGRVVVERRSGVASDSIKQAASAIGAAAAARPRIEIPRTLTPWQRLFLKYQSVNQMRQELLTAGSRRFGAICRGVAQAATSVRVVLDAEMTRETARIGNPRFTVVKGAPMTPELESCLHRTYTSPPMTFAADPRMPFPEFEGEVEFVFHIGTGG